MSQTPFSSGDPSPWSAAPVDPVIKSGGGKTLLVVLLVIALGVFALIVAACGLSYFGIQQAIRPKLPVVLPHRSEQAGSDASRLAASMQPPHDAGPVADAGHPEAAEIRRWFAAQLALAQQGKSIAPQADLFYAAVMGSPEGDGLNLLQQIQLRASLDAGLPEPAPLANYMILEIAAESVPDTARVAVVFYAPDSLANLQTWYVVKADNQWELYDWFEADVGRRKSDEYAHYCRHIFHDHVDGFDEAEQLVFEATEANAAGDIEDARALLERAERFQMLPYDRDRSLLSIGRGYQHLGDEAQAEKVFQKARQPAAVPGILASLGISQNAIDKPQAALDSADQLRKIYPHHPAADLVSAYAHEHLNQDSQAADHYLRCLEICPNDTTVFSWLLLVAHPQHAAKIVQTLQRSEHSEAFLLQLFGRIENDTDMLAAVDAALAEMETVPALWKAMSNASLQHARGDVQGALQQLSEAIPPPTKTPTKTPTKNALAGSAAGTTADSLGDALERWLVQWSLDSGEFGELQKREDFDRLIQQAAEELFLDEYFPDTATLESNLATLPDAKRKLPSVLAVRGWAAWQEDRYADAVTYFSAWLDTAPIPATVDSLAAEESADDPGLHDEIPWYLNHSLASLGRFEEALVRFAEDRALCWDTLEMLIQRRDREMAKNVREQIASRDTPTAAMVSAAIDASLAAWEGSAEEADRNWIACLKAFGEIDPESYSRESQAFDSIARRRGQTAVRLRRVVPLLVDSSVPGWGPTVEEICDHTSDLWDSQLAEQITEALLDDPLIGSPAASASTVPPARIASPPARIASAVWEMNAEIAELQHDWESAVDLRRRLLNADDQETWEIQFRRRAFADALLHSAESLEGNELPSLLSELDDDSLWASFDAARGKDPEVLKSLSDLDSEQRGQWYASAMNRPYVLHNRELAQWLAASESPLCIAYTPPLESILLGEDQPRAITAAEIEAAVSAILGPEAAVTEVTTGLSENVLTRWAIRLPDAIDILVTSGAGKIQTDSSLPAAAAEGLAKSQGYIAIDVIRSDRPVHRVGLPLATQLASETTRLVHAKNSNYLWYGTDTRWSERLASTEMLPVDAQSLAVDYLYLETGPPAGSANLQDPSTVQDEVETGEGDGPASGAALEAEWLRAKLAEGNPPYPVLLQIPAGNAVEWIPAVATAIDAETWRVDLELRENSAVLPALRKGQRVRANTYHLIHP